MPNPQWTEREEYKLRKMVEGKVPTYRIAQLLKRSERAVINKIMKLNCSRTIRKWTKDEYKILVKMRLEKKTYAECAAVLDRTELAIQQKCERLGLNVINPVQVLSQEDRDLLVKMRDGLPTTWEDIAARFNISVTEAYRVYYNTFGFYNEP